MTKLTHWKQTQGNKFFLKIDERFLTHKFLKGEESVVIERNVSKKGKSKFKFMRDSESLVQVEYDRDYLIEYIVYYLKPLFNLPWIQLTGLIKEAFKRDKDD